MLTDKIDDTRLRLTLYREAEKAILCGQAYTIGTRSLTRANLRDVQRMIKELEDYIDLLESSGGKRKVRRAIPLDV